MKRFNKITPKYSKTFGRSNKQDLDLPVFSFKDDLSGGLVETYECCGQGCCDHQENSGEVSVEMALEALDSLDDYARMTTGIVATGPIKVLVKYILDNAKTTNPETLKVYNTLINT